uniref:SpoU_methylase domain-containing protein n=1 Tax=Strongyloides papillosus TaxID=174720 RepID=A0A0N5CDA8_STREA
MVLQMIDALISKIEDKSVCSEDFKLLLIHFVELNIDICLDDFIRIVKQIHNFQDDQPLEEKILFIKLLEFSFNCLKESDERDLAITTFIEEMKIATNSEHIPYTLSAFYPNYQSKVSVCLNQICANDPDTNDIFDMQLLKKIGYELQFLGLISPRKVVSSLVLKIFIKQIIMSEWLDSEEDVDDSENTKYPLIILQLKRFLVESFQSKLSPPMFSRDGYNNIVNVFSKLSSCYYTGNIENERKDPLVNVNLICNTVLIPMAFTESTAQLAFTILAKLIDLSNLNLCKFKWQNLSPEVGDESKFKIEGMIALAIHHLPYFARKENSEGLFCIFSTLHKISEKLSADKFRFSKPIVNHQLVKLKSLDWIYAYVVMRFFKSLWNIEKLIIPKCFQHFMDEDSLLKYKFIRLSGNQDFLTCFTESLLEMFVLSEFCAEDFLENNNFKKIFDSGLLRTALSRGLFYPYGNHILPSMTSFKNIFSILMRKFNITPLSSIITYYIDPTDDNSVLTFYNRSIVKQLITSIFFNSCQLPKLFPENYKNIDESVEKVIRSTYLSMVNENAIHLEKRINEDFIGKIVSKDSTAKCFIIMSSEINLYVCQINSLLQLGVPESDLLFKSVTKKVVEVNDLITSIKVNNSFLE